MTHGSNIISLDQMTYYYRFFHRKTITRLIVLPEDASAFAMDQPYEL